MDRVRIVVLLCATAGCSFPRVAPVEPSPAQMMVDGQAPHLIAVRTTGPKIVYGAPPLRPLSERADTERATLQDGESETIRERSVAADVVGAVFDVLGGLLGGGAC